MCMPDGQLRIEGVELTAAGQAGEKGTWQCSRVMMV